MRGLCYLVCLFNNCNPRNLAWCLEQSRCSVRLNYMRKWMHSCTAHLFTVLQAHWPRNFLDSKPLPDTGASHLLRLLPEDSATSQRVASSLASSQSLPGLPPQWWSSLTCCADSRPPPRLFFPNSAPPLSL